MILQLIYINSTGVDITIETSFNTTIDIYINVVLC